MPLRRRASPAAATAAVCCRLVMAASARAISAVFVRSCRAASAGTASCSPARSRSISAGISSSARRRAVASRPVTSRARRRANNPIIVTPTITMTRPMPITITKSTTTSWSCWGLSGPPMAPPITPPKTSPHSTTRHATGTATITAKVDQIVRRVPRCRPVPWELNTPMWRHSWIDAGAGNPMLLRLVATARHTRSPPENYPGPLRANCHRAWSESPYCDGGGNRGSRGRSGARAYIGAGEAAVESPLLAANSSGAGDEKAAAAVRSGEVPSLADCFSTRPETVPGLADALAPGRPIVLTGPEARRHLYDWPGGTGKTQLAAYLAESLWRARQIELLVWVTATSRASVLAGYAQAFADRAGTAPAGDAETAAARLTGWLATTSRPWLVVLDDLAAAADLEGLWPQGPAGRVVVTTRSPVVLRSAPSPLTLPIGAFSSHEALTYLMARLSSDPDQRIGAVDLLEDLGREPLALAQASATIANSGLTCRDYRDLFARRRDQIAQAVTWTLSVEQADQLLPGRLAQPCLALAVLLDCHGIPGDVFSTPAASEFIAGHLNGDAPDAKRSAGALRSLERTGLLTIDPASAARTVWVHPVVQAAARSATPQPMRDQAARAAARALLQAWPAD